MQRKYLVIVAMLMLIAIYSCSKKSTPNGSLKTNNESTGKKADSTAVVRSAVKRKTVAAIPKVIVVNDQFANKSVDGRYYYDLEGHRYWRSNKDGKYYLFNKSMTTDAAFQKPQ